MNTYDVRSCDFRRIGKHYGLRREEFGDLGLVCYQSIYDTPLIWCGLPPVGRRGASPHNVDPAYPRRVYTPRTPAPDGCRRRLMMISTQQGWAQP